MKKKLFPSQIKTCPFDAVIFDLDGVITKTTMVHAAAWKETFDAFLKKRAKKTKEHFRAFTVEGDYLNYVDGKPRDEGVKGFLESREIRIPHGRKDDAPSQETICGLGNQKNIKFHSILQKTGADVYISTVVLIKDLRKNGIHVGVASSSKNCQLILESSKLENLFETRVDGVVSEELGLKGKPEPDIFIKAAENMKCKPKRSIVVEDAVSGVQAGAKGGFALVIGVARENNQEVLKTHGADVVVTDFQGVNTKTITQWFDQQKGLPFSKEA